MITVASGQDDLLFEEDKDTADNLAQHTRHLDVKWKIIIVDDDEDVHRVTKLTLKRLVFEGKGIEFYSAYSAAEGKKLVAEHNDAAVILLDVVMEEDHAGLELARFIRKELENKMVRIILRTGYPGQAPEEIVAVEYDINDYREKTELTTLRLTTTIITALRSFRDLTIIDANRRGLHKVIDSSVSIFKVQSMSSFATGVFNTTGRVAAFAA